MLLVHESLNPKEIIIQSDVSLHCDSFNLVACDLLSNKSRSRRICLLVIYAVPNIKIDVLKSLTIVLSKYNDDFSGTSIVCGDFNMPNFDWELSVLIGDLRHDMFIDFCCQHTLPQYMLMPTRESHVLDIILSNDHDSVSNFEVCQPLANSDHC